MSKVRRIQHEIIGLLSISCAVIILISLLTHNKWDPSLFTHTPYEATEVKNLLGFLGSYLSDIMLQALGFTAYLIPLMLCIYGLRKTFGVGKKHRFIITTGATIVLILSLSALLSLIFEESTGGIAGFLATRLSLKVLSTTGSYLLFIPLVCVTLMFLVPFSIIDFIKIIRNVRIPSVNIPFRKKHKVLPQIELEEPPLLKQSVKQESLPLTYQSEPKTRIVQKTGGDYELPRIDLLKDSPPSKSRPTKEDLLSSSGLLERKLLDFSVEGKVTHVSPGPVVTLFEFEPAPGIKIHKVVSLADDLALTLKAESLRISPIPGRATLGIEVPNKEREDVFLKDILSADVFRRSSSKLTMALGKDIFGAPIVADLSRMPHLLIAGATGSGKSIYLNTIVLSFLYRATPRQVKMIMIDPKMLELPVYEEIPHLLMPIITSPKDASDALKKIVFEMERRYRLLAETGSRNIETYNKKIKSALEEDLLPYLIIFIDELADLMLISAHEVENSIARLAQMARAAGIHLILATQRPSVDVITGVIKANFSSRISFRVASKIDSRIILDTYGAEQLLGKGDMLFTTPGHRTMRIHGAYVSEEEVRDVVDFIRTQGSPDYSLFDVLMSEENEESILEDRDEFYKQARDLVLSTGQASISYIQRRLKIGYNRAARIMEMMEEEGLVGPPGEAGKPREILRKRR
ncbi:MAG: DNA translocase FtsK [Thermodesulfovibrionia bacterium]|nr:DNA translocase FtsK [Thermodesulfovibrionia bacterium]